MNTTIKYNLPRIELNYKENQYVFFNKKDYEDWLKNIYVMLIIIKD